MENISLMEAYLIEFLRIKDISNEEIFTKTVAKDTGKFEALYPKLDFSLLTALAEEDQEAFKAIVNDGYKVKFLTINGLKKLLDLKLNIKENDYEEKPHGLFNLKVTSEELNKIKAFASSQWQFKSGADHVDIFVGQ